MPRKKKRYKVVGEAPVVIDGTQYFKDEVVETSSDVHFLVGVGALKEQKDK